MKKKLAVIQALLLAVIIVCAGYIVKYYHDANDAQDDFDELKQIVLNTDITEVEGNYLGYSEEDIKILEGYGELAKKNSDMFGWVKIPDTKIDYPVVRYRDNEYYLHKNFEKKYQYSGIPFLDYQCGENSVNMIVYAHNMKNGSMFAALADYEDKVFYDKHREILFDTLSERGKYRVIAAFTTKVGSKNEFKYYNYADIDSKERFDDYISAVKRLSFYDTGVTAQYGDKLLTLSTCAYHTSNERFVVVAKKINKR